jgi:hypothetical protein
MPKKEKYKPLEIVYFTAVWKLPFHETKDIIPKLGRAQCYYYNQDWANKVIIEKRINITWSYK